MTVSYQYEVASSTSGGFTRLLFMWRGSLYKLIYRELLLFLAAFGLLSALYRNAFNSDQRKIFEKMVMYCDTFINLIPLSFVLGFYVSYVASRWWQQYLAIPWPDKIMHSIALYVSGNDEHGRMVRRTLMRYLNLTLILVLRSISSAVKRRFPTLEHVVESGFMTTVELEMYQSVPSVEFNTYWIPCTWFISLLKESKRNNQIEDSQGLHIIMEEFNDFRSKCGLLWSYDWVSIPLVYTQVVTIATYSFFLAALVGRQYVDAAKKPLQMEIDIYLPVFTILQFFFFMGLLKVAEQLINPFGDDDEDFELNWLIDRHTKVSYLGVDILMASAPPLVKDMYFDQVDLTLPYTEASVAYKKKTYRGSVHNMTVPEEKHTMYLPEISEEDEDRTPTPRSSLSNVQSMAHSRPSDPATVPAAAAAAGTWRSHHPSTQSFHKNVEVDTEFEGDSASWQRMEMCVDMASIPQEQTGKQRLTSMKSMIDDSEKVTRPLCRSESVPAKRPVFVTKNILGWPSSSTLGHSDLSFQLSEQSIDMQSCHNSSTYFSANTGRGYDPEHTGTAGGQQTSSYRRNSRGDGENECGYHGNRFSSGSGIICNHSSKISQVSLDSYRMHKYNEQWHPSPREETDYVTFEGNFRNSCFSKVKSCPKLVLVKRQSSMNNGKKKGVRWKPMVNTTQSSSNETSSQRRQTVEILPMVSDLPDTGPESKMKSEEIEITSPTTSRCKWCRRQSEVQDGIPTLSTDSEKFVNESGDSVSDWSLAQEHFQLHHRINNSEFKQTHPISANRLTKGIESIQYDKCSVFQERRATLSTLSLTGSELEARRWQSKSFWKRVFFKKLKYFYNRKGARAISFISKNGSSALAGKKLVSQSLPNITFPQFHTESKPSNSNIQSVCYKQVTPTVKISDMTSTESDGSSCFASIVEMQEEEEEESSKDHVISLSTPEDEKKKPNMPIHLSVTPTRQTSKSNLSVSNNSCEYFNTSSPDSSWQSADWSGILHTDQSTKDPSDLSHTSKDVLQASSATETADSVSNVLQEVVIDSKENESDSVKVSKQTVL